MITQIEKFYSYILNEEIKGAVIFFNKWRS